MSRVRRLPRSTSALALLALLPILASACGGEDGKTAPEKCNDPPLPIFDIQAAGVPNVDNPCVTQPGYAISGTTTTAGGTSSDGTAGEAAGGP